MVNCAVYGFILSLVLLVSGQEENRIVGGFYAAPGQIPYQASLQEAEQHFCGATIISNRWLITAAHCISDATNVSAYSVLVGTNDLKNPGQFSARYALDTLLPNPFYNDTRSNDIGLLRTTNQIQFNRFVIAAPISGLYVPPFLDAFTSGWGLTSYPGNSSSLLKFLVVDTIGNRMCNSTSVGPIARDNLCTVNPLNTSICLGDSGGPLTHRNVLIGVTSWVVPCGKNKPDGYTRISSHIRWIRSKVPNVVVLF